MEETIIRIIPFNGENEKLNMWSGKFLARSGRLGYDTILRDAVKPLADIVEENTKEDYVLKQINKKA